MRVGRVAGAIVRGLPRTLHVLLVIFLSTTCVCTIVCWILMIPPSRRPESQEIIHKFSFCGLSGNLDVYRWSNWQRTELTVTPCEGVTKELLFWAHAHGPPGSYDVIQISAEFPVKCLRPREPWLRVIRGWTLGVSVRPQYDYFSSVNDEWSSIDLEMARTGLSEDDVRRIAQFPRLLIRIGFPFWFVIVVTGMYPLILFIGKPIRRWRRRKNGLCLHCGYNLQGNVSGVCSECGSETTKAPRHKAES